MDNGQKMKFFKWITFLSLALLITLLAISLHPKTVSHLENNLRKNVIRSFEDSMMPTQLIDLKLSLWPLLINWPSLNIERNAKSQLPNSWLQIFQSIKLSNCTLSINPGWFKLNAEIECKIIDILHLPMRWFFVDSLNSSLSKDFYFVESDFRNLEGKLGWWNTTVKAENLIINGKNIKSFHLNYYFSSQTELVLEWPNFKEKMFLKNEPEQLRVLYLGAKESYGFLSQSFYSDIKSLW